MHTKTIRTGLTAATTAGRVLLAAGWRYDSTSPMADDTTIRTLLHPTGREIHARTADRDDDDTTSLTMTGLSLEQVAGAIAGAGLGEPATQDQGVSDLDTVTTSQPKPDYWLTLADDLRQAADRLATLAGTTQLPVNVSLTILGSWPQDSDPAAVALVNALGVAFDVTPRNLPVDSEHRRYDASTGLGFLDLDVHTYLREEDSELERLRAENDRLQAQLAEGGAAR